MGGSPVLKPDQRSDQLVDQTPTQRHTCSFHPVPFDSSRNSVIGAEPGMAGADTHHSRPFFRMNGNGLGQRPAAYCLLPTGSRRRLLGNGEWAATSPTSGRSCPPPSSDLYGGSIFCSVPFHIIDVLRPAVLRHGNDLSYTENILALTI
ncbi:hypothetical protein SUGI_1513990 [Cryptomeria japonica]|uniref:Uncharacterized protein n=1 Tax=Cryptomeria japonica TaxID=3369 RepID=A0AAD3NPH2_CRYJA|nr:hypothetical protein SUGI_1485380 [Cryptomeria japonica]GLJ59056.1 hypothetical protein SUGI_1490430 [Cryptomeria japonica]GLJ59314.1 hypothetical protein SUGI_1502680 [Cryptomeria japonica]GLJ59416.1 hypothetical protein SUGI_1507770 [Cryptomeria japonica]GLJ59555.1 hypothetical protein SUGI_1513990 [Cryptomeria japonica]